jgi:hypothetical protein
MHVFAPYLAEVKALARRMNEELITDLQPGIGLL